MNRLPIEERLLRNVRILSQSSPQEMRMVPRGDGAFPSVAGLRDIVSLVRAIVFPDFFDCRRNNERIRSCYLGVNIEKLYSLLHTEIRRALRFDNTYEEEEVSEEASLLALQFIDELPEIKRLLFTDVEAMYDNDPAADNYAEIILSYPVVNAMVHYRSAHVLLKLGIPVIPRVITELAHSTTGIDINPGATIGEYFAIDHGTGVVIGETCIIGNHVTLYQGVTLGAKNFSLDSNGHPLNIPRHPIIEDNVTIYSNSTILGRITVGHDSVIGGNIWLTHSVEPWSRIVQQKAFSQKET
ncbi:serine O-acetyltransferase [Lepagella muris]|jgi:serine O-acetyltransferase|uniref:Serine acetyltransferase n=1 Tax=Lepagella muris TaxID=3032870 RepID=A0AC61RAJ8_9BACT|nr:serine O-acetyltransferase [Lepagella muris]ROT09959.1 serine acetyltransferase [Muribaculaceae bacterium Isolate-037 (Harlan)]TGY76329.1 serine acetyltransferase [Lepagella muris]THG51889.1 serine acetyltransferase [Bacteroidales bacterium]TKC64326.1 serine acetyltransferase [Bacteroidales bacterium]